MSRLPNILASQIGEWTAYTPTWSASGSAPSIGNGVLTGKYTVIGKTVHFKIRVTMGSSTTFGTGYYTFSLPVTAVNTSFPELGSATLFDTVNFRLATAVLASTTTVGLLYDTGTNYLGSTTPFTWAASCYLELEGTYEAA